MLWNFLKKNKDAAAKPTKPKELPSRVGRYLVVDLKYDPDWVWALRMVTAGRADQKSVFDFRIFDAGMANMEGVPVKGYDSLDGHPQVIYFDGWYDKDTWQMQVNDRYGTLKNAVPA